MLWATGVGAEVIAPMAVPVLGGLLISDEVVDIFLPVRFYWVRRARWIELQRQRQASAQTGEGGLVLPTASEPAAQAQPLPAAGGQTRRPPTPPGNRLAPPGCPTQPSAPL